MTSEKIKGLIIKSQTQIITLLNEVYFVLTSLKSLAESTTSSAFLPCQPKKLLLLVT